MNDWSASKKLAFRRRRENPNEFYYRFNANNEEEKRGNWGDNEIELFMERVREMGVNGKWGTFSKPIPGRTGYQCSNLWRQLIEDGKVNDYNYNLQNGKVRRVRRLNNGNGIPQAFRKYGFVVLQDIPGPYNAGDRHQSCPDNFDDIVAEIPNPGGNERNERIRVHYDMDVDSDSDSD